jgi:hypothetical protein
MTRALSVSCLALLLVALGGSAARAGKPSIAVLGLEVVDNSGAPSAQDTQVAKDLTEGLRSRAKAGTGPYQIAAGSDKELIDEKLLKNCDSELPACMTAIGNDLGADMLMFGKMEKSAKGYQITLKLLDVHRKVLDKSSTTVIPLNQATGADVQGWAKKIYGGLTGENSTGTLVVKLSNADRGTILIDGDAKGNITNGTGQVAGLAEGKYKVAIESEGFHRWEQSISISAGQPTNVPVDLVKSAGGTGPGIGTGNPLDHSTTGTVSHASSGNGAWKGVFVASVVVGLAGGGVILWGKSQIDDATKQLCAGGGYPGRTDCPAPSTGALSASAIGTLNDKGDAGHLKSMIGTGVAVAAGGFAIFALYKGFIAKGEPDTAEHVERGHRVRRDRFVVTPVIAPNGGGASVQFDW